MENQIQIILDSILFQNQYPNHLEVLSWCFSPCLSFKASCLPAPWSQTANCLVSYDTIWAFYKMEAQDFMNYHDCHHWNSHKKGVPLWDKSMLWTSYPSCFFDGNVPPSLHSRIPKSHWYWSPRLRQKPSRRRESLSCVWKKLFQNLPWLVGGFSPSEKYESQIGSSSQLLGKIKNVANHQPDEHGCLETFDPGDP